MSIQMYAACLILVIRRMNRDGVHCRYQCCWCVTTVLSTPLVSHSRTRLSLAHAARALPSTCWWRAGHEATASTVCTTASKVCIMESIVCIMPSTLCTTGSIVCTTNRITFESTFDKMPRCIRELVIFILMHSCLNWSSSEEWQFAQRNGLRFSRLLTRCRDAIHELVIFILMHSCFNWSPSEEWQFAQRNGLRLSRFLVRCWYVWCICNHPRFHDL